MITIIGGSGFVGSSLIKRLGLTSVVNLDKRKSHFFNQITQIGNICSKKDIKLHPQTKLVILLAAEHKDNISPKSLYYEVNVEGTKNVLSVMEEQGINNIIFTSSVAIYGLNKKKPDETIPAQPFNDYGKSKLLAEEVIKNWCLRKPLERSATIIRPTVIFGKRNRGNVYNLLNQINLERFVMIGNGNNKKSMAYVENVVAFIVHKTENIKKGLYIYNYADKPDLTMNELTSFVALKLGVKIPKMKIPYLLGLLAGLIFDFYSLIAKKKLKLSLVRVKKFCSNTQFDSTKAHNTFNPPYSIKEGLNKTLNYEFNNINDEKVLFYSE